MDDMPSREEIWDRSGRFIEAVFASTRRPRHETLDYLRRFTRDLARRLDSPDVSRLP